MTVKEADAFLKNYLAAFPKVSGYMDKTIADAKEMCIRDRYQVAKAATVTVAPTGEVILVCAEDHDTILANIEKALAA